MKEQSRGGSYRARGATHKAGHEPWGHAERARAYRPGFYATAASVVMAGALSACSLSPDYVKPAVALPDRYKEEAPAREDIHWRPAAVGANTNTDAADAEWWHRFGDAELDRLEAQAMASNQTLAAAVADYGAARAVVAQLDAARYPSVDAVAGASRSRDTSAVERENRYTYYPITSVHAVAEARWEPDIWGAARSRVAAADASSASAAAVAAGARLSLAAALASAYFDLRALDLDLRDLEQERQQLVQLAAMTRAGVEQGIADDDAVARARNAVDIVDAQAERERALRARDEHAVAAIAGAAPAAFAIAPVHGYRLPAPEVRPGLPSALLERRPDLVQAERNAAAAYARIGEARAAFFPDLVLGTDIGGQNSALAGLLSAPMRIWSVGSSLAVSLFDAGAHSAQLEQAHKESDAATARYRAAVIAAMQDVEDALATLRHNDQATQRARQVQGRSEEILKRQQTQEGLGLTSPMSLIQIRLDALEARRQWRASLAASTQDRVALIKAVGGNWHS